MELIEEGEGDSRPAEETTRGDILKLYRKVLVFQKEISYIVFTVWLETRRGLVARVTLVFMF